MTTLLCNKVIAITGSSSGIGRAIAIACASQGAMLVLHHLDSPEAQHDVETLLEELSQIDASRKHSTFNADITHPSAAEGLIGNAIQHHGRLDCLVNNAGICRFADFHDVSQQMLEQHMAVNFTAAYMFTQAATKQMVKQGHGGSIVSIASITAALGSSTLTHYSPTKAAILGMTVSCAVALGPDGIRFNSVSPGTIETSMNKAHLDAEGVREGLAARVPLRRLGRPEDVAKAVVFFASDLSEYVTGQSLLVDGGASIFYQ
jgi:L-rhamnose 1-dehydrogenase